ncbi:uncharacterized protein TNCV_1726791 [Trichonephila clavipes]|nr:uncharacterized protein TNCV_1726791 [Trichonephila clavipes]
MGARLRNLKTMNCGKNLSDGESISGKNRLTDKFIDTITAYYGNVIRQNNSHISDMRQAIWAIYCHYRSTDEEPMHHFCPIGDTSWCKYQKAVATNSASLFKHKNTVPIAIMDEIKPLIAELSAPKFLKKCVWGGYWFDKSINAFVVNDLKVNKNTVADWYMFRKVCMIRKSKEDSLFAGLYSPENISEAKFHALKSRPIAGATRPIGMQYILSMITNFIVSSNRLLLDMGLRVTSNLYTRSRFLRLKYLEDLIACH